MDSWYYKSKFDETPNVLKLDVEGHELDVLEGSMETLKNIQIVQFEFGGTCIDSRKYFLDYWRFFSNLGFDLYRMAPKGLIRIISYSERDETFRFTNVFAVKSQLKLKDS